MSAKIKAMRMERARKRAAQRAAAEGGAGAGGDMTNVQSMLEKMRNKDELKKLVRHGID